MADIFREVDEDLRAERTKALWRKYGALVVGAAAAVVLAVAGVQYWQYWQSENRAEAGSRLLAAASLEDEGQADEAALAFAALAGETGRGAGLLARFRQAALLAREDDPEGAGGIYAELVGDADVPALYRDLARLMLGMHHLGQGRAEEALDMLKPLEENGPFAPSARELVATAHIMLSDLDAAREGFTRLAEDEDTPASMRTRAREMLAGLDS